MVLAFCMKNLFSVVGMGVIVFAVAAGDSNACSHSPATADISVYQNPETGETIEVYASAFGESGVIFRFMEKCEDIGENKLCSESGKGN